MTDQTMYMTSKGFSRIDAELARLRARHLNMAEDLHDAQSGGDSIDNTELITLREEVNLLVARIHELDEILRHATLIEPGACDGKVHLGNTVAVQIEGERIETYTIVGPVEADPSEGFISDKSPLGRALLNHGVGDCVEVVTPDGQLEVRIVAVT